MITDEIAQEEVLTALGTGLAGLVEAAVLYVDPTYLAKRLKAAQEPLDHTESCVLLLLHCISIHISTVEHQKRGSQDDTNTPDS